MHRFNRTDAQILLGLSYAEKSAAQGAEITCEVLITHCLAIAGVIPSAAEFSFAFNKLLYLSAIVINGEKLALAALGQDIIDSAQRKTSGDDEADEWVMLINKELAVYKLKSMCNRTVWSPERYQQAISAMRNH